VRGGRNLRWAVVALVGALAVVAIVAAVESGGDPSFQSDVARALADRSDAVAASLVRGKRCAADRDAERLRTESIVAVRTNLVSPQAAGELLTRTRVLARSITCPPPAPPTPAPATKTATTRRVPPSRSEDHGDGQDGDRGEHGRGKKRGHRGDQGGDSN